jgi:zinc finger SWIM domain-containing protein 3
VNLDFEASYKPCLEADASVIVNEAARRFTPGVFHADVQYGLKAVETCYLIKEMDGYNIVEYKVGRVDKRDKQNFVKCEICVVKSKVKEISCSSLKLQSLGTPYSHIFFVLGHHGESKLLDCCVLERWTMGAKCGFLPIRKSTMYDYSDHVQRCHDLQNISQTTSFATSQSLEAYERLKHTLKEEAAMIPTNRGEGGCKRFGPVLPQAQDVDSAEYYIVFIPYVCVEEGHRRKS